MQEKEAPSKPDPIEDDGEPFNVTELDIECPFGDGVMLPMEVGWVNRTYPMIHLNAPSVVEHLRAEHGSN